MAEVDSSLRARLGHDSDVNFIVVDELPIKGMVINFMPSWWQKEYGISFGERYIFDPDYRVETTLFKWRAINERFPELHVGARDPKPEVIPVDYQNALGPAVAGCEIMYPENNYPLSRHLSEDRLGSLKIPDDPENAFPYKEMIGQVKYLNRKFNKDVNPFIFKNGILNDAVLIRGDQIFLDLMDENEIAKQVMDFSFDLGVKVFEMNFKNRSMPAVMPLCNCTAELIGPETYESAQLDYDSRMLSYLKSRGQKTMLHHCGFFDPFISQYKKLPEPEYLQIGFKSDPKAALNAFPNSHVDYCYSANWMATATAGEVEEKTKQVLEASRGNWHRFSVSIGDIDVGVPEEYLMIIYECIKRAS
ncbi:MAG: uroporphyrinogen decarboxylase family protein [Clostridia bacterium]|nr:uroporphyrinogen decarboxylase family protein [Clostridia bacterium]